MGKTIRKHKAKKKPEWSKIMCGIIIFYGMANGIMYHIEMFMAFNPNNVMGIMPDSSLAVQCVVTILGGVSSYLLYNGALKLSLNKNKLMIDQATNTVRALNNGDFLDAANQTIQNDEEFM